MHHFNYHDSKHNKIENEIILLKTSRERDEGKIFVVNAGGMRVNEEEITRS